MRENTFKCSSKYLKQFVDVELSCNGLIFQHPRQTDFILSQWLWFKPKIFTVYRIIVTLLLIAWMIGDIFHETKLFTGPAYVWLAYGTNWTFMLIVFNFIIQSIACLIYNCIKDRGEHVPAYQLIWFLHNLSSTAGLIICTAYWFGISHSKVPLFAAFLPKLKHSLIGVFIVFDTCLISIPMRIVHAIYPLTTSIIYAIFTYLFWYFQLQGPYAKGRLYPGIEWENPGPTALLCFYGVLGCLLMHVLLYIVYFARCTISTALGGRGYELIERNSFSDTDIDNSNKRNCLSYDPQDNEINNGGKFNRPNFD